MCQVRSQGHREALFTDEGTKAQRGLVFGPREFGWRGPDLGFRHRQTGVSLGASLVAMRVRACACACVCVLARTRACVCAPTAPRPQRGSSALLPAAPLPGSMFPNSLHKILLMPGFLAADTVRALFPLPHPCQREALGLSSERQTAQWLPKRAWTSQVSGARRGRRPPRLGHVLSDGDRPSTRHTGTHRCCEARGGEERGSPVDLLVANLEREAGRTRAEASSRQRGCPPPSARAPKSRHLQQQAPAHGWL